MPLSQKEIKGLQQKARDIRKNIVEVTFTCGG